MSGFWKVCSFLCTQYLVRLRFALITASMHCGMEAINLWHCWGVMKPRLLLQLQFTPCEALPSVWISFAWLYSQACCHPCCLCTFSYPISSFQSTLHLICFDTALLEQPPPPLSVMTLCDLLSLWRVSMFVFWTIAKSAVFPVIVLSKNKRFVLNLYCMDGHLLKHKCKYKYSNILRYWFLTFISSKR